MEEIKGNYLSIAGIDTLVLNLGSYDFLNQGENQSAKKAAEQTLLKYGVGSCGPRGFYGTIDLHLKFEEEIAKHMGTQVYFKPVMNRIYHNSLCNNFSGGYIVLRWCIRSIFHHYCFR